MKYGIGDADTRFNCFFGVWPKEKATLKGKSTNCKVFFQ